MYNSTKTRAIQVQKIVEDNYEEGTQSRCKLWVYRHIVKPKFGISERTFFRCLSRFEQVTEQEASMPKQLEFDFMM